MKVSDYIANFIASRGIRHVFTLPGGFSMHLNDSIGHHPDITPVYMLHEAGAAIAAEAYAKVTGGMGVCVVTAGPGATNAVTGCASAWLDSVPVLFISGQVKRADLARGMVRESGPQEVDIIGMVKGITKTSRLVENSDIANYLYSAEWHMMDGRHGPAWLDIPLDVQAMETWSTDETQAYPSISIKPINDIGRVCDLIASAKRPIVLAGTGIIHADARDEFLQIVDMLGMPVLTTWLAADLIDYNHPLFIGRPGPVAQRGANLALQNADLLISVGARIDVAMAAWDIPHFAYKAKHIVIDIDQRELNKLGSFADMPICADAGQFIRAMIDSGIKANYPDWLIQCQEWKQKYYAETIGSTYARIADMLSDTLTPEHVIVIGAASQSCAAFFATFRQKAGQRIIHSGGLGSMGYDIPYAIGACLGSGGKRTICITGDGSFMQNIQELEVVLRLNLPIHFIVFNNGGYASIRNSQQKAFGRLSGANEQSGLTLPSIDILARAWGMDACAARFMDTIKERITGFERFPHPMLTEVYAQQDEVVAPRVQNQFMLDGTIKTDSLENLWPYLSPEELSKNMICLT